MTPDLIRNLADITSRLRHMWDDTDGDTHMPREDSDEICKAVTEIAKALGCKDDWGHVADGIRALADAIAAPGLPEGWTWHINGVGAYHYPKPGGPIVEARVVQDRLELFGPVPLPVIAAVLARAGVTT